MMVNGRKTLAYPEQMQVRTEPGVRLALKEAAKRRGTTMTALIRDALQAAIVKSCQTEQRSV